MLSDQVHHLPSASSFKPAFTGFHTSERYDGSRASPTSTSVSSEDEGDHIERTPVDTRDPQTSSIPSYRVRSLTQADRPTLISEIEPVQTQRLQVRLRPEGAKEPSAPHAASRSRKSNKTISDQRRARKNYLNMGYARVRRAEKKAADTRLLVDLRVLRDENETLKQTALSQERITTVSLRALNHQLNHENSKNQALRVENVRIRHDYHDVAQRYLALSQRFDLVSDQHRRLLHEHVAQGVHHERQQSLRQSGTFIEQELIAKLCADNTVLQRENQLHLGTIEVLGESMIQTLDARNLPLHS